MANIVKDICERLTKSQMTLILANVLIIYTHLLFLKLSDKQTIKRPKLKQEVSLKI